MIDHAVRPSTPAMPEHHRPVRTKSPDDDQARLTGPALDGLRIGY